MYILRLQYKNGELEYREYSDLYSLETIMNDISMDFNVYADLESVKAFIDLSLAVKYVSEGGL